MLTITNTYKSIYNNKNILLLMQGAMVSSLGSSIHGIAVTWFILSSANFKNSGILLSIFSICWIFPGIFFSPIAGVVIDKVNRKKIIVSADLLPGLFMLALAILTHFNIIPLISLMVITFFPSATSTFFNPAVIAIIPNIVPKEHLMKVNTIKEMLCRISFVVGASVAGYLYYKFGIVSIFIINGISYIISGLLELFIQLPLQNLKYSGTKKMGKILDGIFEGIQFIKKDKPVFALFTFGGFTEFCVKGHSRIK